MSVDSEAKPRRRPRADAERNRAKLMEAAKNLFAAKGTEAGLEEIARAAGVGIGTLYRNFPNRDALVEQVYRHEIEQLGEAAETLAASHPPVEALRAWLLMSVDYLAAKRAMAELLQASEGGTSELYAHSGQVLKSSVAMLVERASEAGEVRVEVEALDLLRALAGVATAGPGPNWQQSARNLVDILIAGIRTGKDTEK